MGFNPRAKLAFLAASFFVALALTGCPASQTENASLTSPSLATAQDKSAGAFADLDPWVLKTTDPNANRGNHGIYLSNGFIGATFGASGDAGNEGVSFVAGEYSQPPQESLTPIQNGHDLHFRSPLTSEPYEQRLDMRRGVLTTVYKAGRYQPVTATFLVGAGDTGLRTIGLQVRGAPVVVSNPPINPVIPDPHGWRFTVGVDANNTPELIGTYYPAGPSAYKPPINFAQALKSHERTWAKRWADADITIEGDPEAQQLVHKLQFDLMQSARPGGDDSIAPEALSGNFYKGHIFWDAEVWMLPALLPQRPELARTILDYRFKHLDAARAQAKAQGCKGADFPWESAATGKETAPAGFSKGRHVTAGVGWATWQYYLATGDKQWMQERGWPLLSQIADYFATRAKKNASGKYDLADVTGPDEFAIGVTNNTYTNAMAQNCLRYAGEAAKLLNKPANPQWKTVADNLALPFDKAAGRYLKHQADDGKPGVKQADGELLLWPAQLPMDKKTQEATFDFHKARVIKNGPAMTSSIHALVAARLGRADEAEQHFRNSYRPFVRGPFLLFSEKRSLDRCVFTTGAGGVLQSVLYGFGGLDYTQKSGVIPGPVALPKTWKRLTITGIHRAGKRYTLTVTPEGRTLTAE